MLCWLICSVGAVAAQAGGSVQVTPLEAVNALIAEKYFVAADNLAGSVAANARSYLWLPDYVQVYRLIEEGPTEQAEPLARNLYQRFPDNVDVRQALINALWAVKKYHRAMYYVDINDSLVSDPAVKQQYRRLKAEYENIYKPYGISLSMGAEPSTNINNGTAAKTVEVDGIRFLLDEDAQEHEGVNLSAELNGYYIHRLAEDIDLVAKGAIGFTKRLENADENILSLILAPELQWALERARWGLGPVLQYQEVGGESYIKRYGMGAFLLKNLKKNSSFLVRGQALRQDYTELDYRDGWRSNLDMRFKWRLGDSLSLSLLPGVELDRTQRRYLDYRAITLGGRIGRRFDALQGVYIELGASQRWQRYADEHPVFGKVRQDNRTVASLTFSHKRFKLFGVHPSIIFEHVRNHSNVDIYSYDANNLRFGISHAF